MTSFQIRLISEIFVVSCHVIRSCDLITDDSDDGGEDDEHDQPLGNLKDRLRELTETHDLALKHNHAMLRQLAEMEGD